MKSYDCENCPLSWEERSYEGDCDCGCYIYGDLYGRKAFCYLPNFIKGIIAHHKENKIAKMEAKQYEGIAEWYEEQHKREIAMRTAIKEVLLTDRYDGERFICHENGGKLYKLDTDSVLLDGAMELIWRYEELLSEDCRVVEGKEGVGNERNII